MVRINRMSRLKIHNTSMVPDIPMSAKVQPNVQLSMESPSVKRTGMRFLGWRELLDNGEHLFSFDGLTDRHF
jgi:hypothetical protein